MLQLPQASRPMKPIQLFIMVVSLSSVMILQTRDHVLMCVCHQNAFCSPFTQTSISKAEMGFFESIHSSVLDNWDRSPTPSRQRSASTSSVQRDATLQANSSKETHNVKLTNQSWCPLPYPQHASCLPTYQSPLPSLLQAERTVSHLFLSNQMIVVKSQDVDSWRI